jgi:hypothetical protein
MADRAIKIPGPGAYYSIPVGGTRSINAAWIYETPFEATIVFVWGSQARYAAANFFAKASILVGYNCGLTFM